jgi:hypothetical protein
MKMKTILTIVLLMMGFVPGSRASETNLAARVLTHLLSTNSTTLVNFKRAVPTQMQASLPKEWSLPRVVGGVTLTPYDDTAKATRFWVEIVSESTSNAVIKAGNTWFVPKAPAYDDGSEFQTLGYRKRNGDWQFEKVVQAGIH